MYVSPELLPPGAVPRHLNPFDKTSIRSTEVSASDAFGNKYSRAKLYGDLDVSTMTQGAFVAEFVFFHMIHLGLKPVKINGPSADPLPV